MVHLAQSYNYSYASIFGWLTGQMQALPSYASLLQLTQLQTVSQRVQSLQRWPLFQIGSELQADCSSDVLAATYQTILESLAPRQALNADAFLIDYIWLQNTMPKVRQIARVVYLESKKNAENNSTNFTDSSSVVDHLQTVEAKSLFLQDLHSKLAEQVSIPDDIQALFLREFENNPGQLTSLLALELLFDKIGMVVLMKHFSVAKSKGIKQWILLSIALDWSKQVARHLKAGLVAPVWGEWFAQDQVSGKFNSLEQVYEALWSSLSGGIEWYIPTKLFDATYLETVDPVEFEKESKSALWAFLNQSVYSSDISLEILKYLFKVRLLLETGATITATNMPTAAAVMQVTCNCDE